NTRADWTHIIQQLLKLYHSAVYDIKIANNIYGFCLVIFCNPPPTNLYTHTHTHTINWCPFWAVILMRLKICCCEREPFSHLNSLALPKLSLRLQLAQGLDQPLFKLVLTY
uniref:Uncharacterized protein n=1 Tax=Myripristis murdjan TaxID=586833 RepID=A0A667X8D4_9TELE